MIHFWWFREPAFVWLAINVLFECPGIISKDKGIPHSLLISHVSSDCSADISILILSHKSVSISQYLYCQTMYNVILEVSFFYQMVPMILDSILA